MENKTQAQDAPKKRLSPVALGIDATKRANAYNEEHKRSKSATKSYPKSDKTLIDILDGFKEQLSIMNERIAAVEQELDVIKELVSKN